MNNIPAFPLNTPQWHESVSDAGFEDIDFTMGMTLRDYFAAKAMQALISKVDINTTQGVLIRQFEKASVSAYWVADAMMKAREA